MLLNLKKYHQVTLFLAVFHNVISLFQILRHINVSRDISSFLGHFPTSIQKKKKKKKKNYTEKKLIYFIKKLHPKNLLYFFEWNLISSITTSLWSLLTNSYIFLKKKNKKKTLANFPTPKQKKFLYFGTNAHKA